VNKITCVLCERTFCEKCVRNFAQGSTDILKRYERYCEECRMPLRSPSRA
jgi:predicted Zn-dependent protease